ncbi:hypothetical protein [Parasediminibacterium sp. JCM 36343]|uniref:hypothetical protein n=1 Tax=Parasediminibacterium sp. JCM 36343 TaxID=3374279 RepID=UPI00397AEFCD
MKKTILVIGSASLAILFVLTACSKNDSSNSTPVTNRDSTLQLTVVQNAADQTIVQNDEDILESDAGIAIKVASNLDGSVPAGSKYDITTLNGAVIDMSSLSVNNKVVKIGYGGSTVNNITKSGNVTITLISGSKFTDAGAVVKETFDSVAIAYNHKTRIYQGTRYIKNIAGGSRSAVSVSFPFIYSIRTSGTVTFEDKSTASYWVARRNSLSNISVNPAFPTTYASDGDSTLSGDTCSIGGTSRYGKIFRVKSAQTYAASTNCGFAFPYQGIRNYISDNTSIKITFGVDANGNPVGNNTTTCAYGYNIQWTKLNGQTGLVTVAY